MLFDQDSGRERLCVVSGQNGDGGLRDDRTFVHAKSNEVDTATRYFYTGVERLLLRVETFECRK